MRENYHLEQLSTEGLSNDLYSYGEICGAQERQIRPYAYCTWVHCGNKTHRWIRSLMKWQRRCPHCGHELTWKEFLNYQDNTRLLRERCQHTWVVFDSGTNRDNTMRIDYCRDCKVTRTDWDRGWDYWHLSIQITGTIMKREFRIRGRGRPVREKAEAT